MFAYLLVCLFSETGSVSVGLDVLELSEIFWYLSPKGWDKRQEPHLAWSQAIFVSQIQAMIISPVVHSK